MGLFKKKAGGTFVGNLLRAGSNKATGGVFGTGANKIELGQTKTNAELASEQGLDYDNGQNRFINDVIPPDQTRTLYWVVGGLVAVLLGVVAYTQGMFTSKKKWGRK